MYNCTTLYMHSDRNIPLGFKPGQEQVWWDFIITDFFITASQPNHYASVNSSCTQCVSKAWEWPQGWQMPGPQAVQNLQLPHPRDWQGGQMPRSRPGECWAQLELTDALQTKLQLCYACYL